MVDPALGFDRFVTVGPYFAMAGAGNTFAYCPETSARTSQTLAELSIFGGTTQEVGPDDNNGWLTNDIESAMRLWWKLSDVVINFSASGTYEYQPSYTPPAPKPPKQTRNWTFTQPENNWIIFDGAPRPNKFGTSGQDPKIERILDCPSQPNFDFEYGNSGFITNDYYEFLYDSYTHLFPFAASDAPEEKALPSQLLIELFCYTEPIIPVVPGDSETVGTNSGLFILSTRNKDYTDAIFEGSESGLETIMIGRKTIGPKVIGGVRVEFYLSLFLLNSNLPYPYSVDSYDAEIIESNLWALRD